jgi:crotonobetaine/carnitine-CoA ligase
VTEVRTEDVLPKLIRRRAGSEGDRPFIVEVDGASLTYLQVHTQALLWADAYRSIGVGTGDTVAVLASTRADGVLSWLGLAWLQAFEVPIHTAYRGRMLAHVLADSGAKVLVTELGYLDTVLEVLPDLPAIRTIVVRQAGSAGFPAVPGRTFLRQQEWLSGARPRPPEREPEPHDVARILYTSGTTGASKGVMVTWAQIDSTARGNIQACHLGPDDAYYSPFPLYHLTGQHTAHVMALTGGRVIIRDPFRTATFWSDIRDYRCTTTVLLGAMANFVYRQPASADDARSGLTSVLMVPVIAEIADFRRRFGVHVGTVFNMTEISTPLTSGGEPITDYRASGRVREGYEARIVDDDDMEVPVGAVGELVLRSREPWMFMAGYWNNQQATARAWRNQWMHTGDAFSRDAEGNFYFVDRKKDAIRRRGENISSVEVESEINSYEAVLESAVVAVPSDWGEDEIKAVVVAKPGHGIVAAELFAYLRGRLPRFMVPRFIEIADDLPRTPTQKVRKVELREAGVTAGTWDVMAAGLDVPRGGHGSSRSGGER